MWVLPSSIMPAAISLRISVAVRGAMRLRQTAVPPVATSPSISTRSLIAMGMPCSGPTAWPERMALSAASAARRAFAALTVAKAWSLAPAVDPRQVVFDQIDRGKPARGDLGGQRVNREESGGGHGGCSVIGARLSSVSPALGSQLDDILREDHLLLPDQRRIVG